MYSTIIRYEYEFSQQDTKMTSRIDHMAGNMNIRF